MEDQVTECRNCGDPLDKEDTNRFADFCTDHCYFKFHGNICEDKECPYCEDDELSD